MSTIIKPEGETIHQVILYTTDNKEHKVTLTKTAKSQLIRKLSYTNTLPDDQSCLVILDTEGKEVKSFPYNELRPFIREL